MGEARNTCDIWVGNLNGLKRKWDDIIKTNLKVICRDCTDWIPLAHESVQ
jgi:hypothetical protein